MKNKVLIGLLIIFALTVIIGLGPWWNDIAGNINPPAPNVSAVYLGFQKPQNIDAWQFVVEDQILTDCTVAYTYSYDGAGKLTVYEVDSGTLRSLGFNAQSTKCSNTREYGVIAVNFTERPEILSIEIWVSQTSNGGNDVYFQQLGNWRFANGSYIGFIAPPVNKDYALLSLERVKELMNRTGIHRIGG